MSDARKPINNGRSWKTEFLPGSRGEKAIESLGLRPDHLRHDLVALDEQVESLAAEITRLREQVPPGHVRLPDGRDVPVLGTLVETADHCIVGHEAKAFVIRRRSVNGHTERYVGSVSNNCEHFARYFASREKALAALQEINR